MKNFKILSLVLVFTTFCFMSCSSGSSPSDVVKKSYELIKKKNYEAVAKLYVKKNGEKLSEDEAKKIEGLLGMASKEIEKKGGYKGITIDSEEISEDGNSATVKHTIEYDNGKSNSETSKLLKVDGKWFILFTMN
ncbi:protein of unknown function [Lutibacter oricola]|uniref:DUF4878 domain-containing protein n=1 Tax=Lutibacter oricola TaxID=762486 RepID=A0A1H3C8H9_9FLAO|nr:DUF4878 domain-containing protein [Lutibacter oricola]SDX49819.1 protein of unknown function [Lutibacter oricola]